MKTLQRIYSDTHSEVYIFNSNENRANINTTIIPDEQLNKILKYRKDEDQAKRLLARTFLFEYCQKRYSLNDFSFEYTKNQRPKFRYSDIDFSISYSQNIIAIALSTKCKIGVDIEFINPSIVTKKIAFEFMNKKELTTFLKINKNDRYKYFYEVWTAKESLLKARGNGLTLNPKDIVNNFGKLIYFEKYIINLTTL